MRSSGSAWRHRPSGCAPIRISCQAACASVLPSRLPCSTSLTSSLPTSRRRRSTSRRRRRSFTNCSSCAAETGTALIWITHDLAVISEIAARVAVMYAGSIVEMGEVSQVLAHPLHPYTLGLLNSVPSRNRQARRLPQIPGSVQSALTAPGCRYAPRCARRTAACDASLPCLAPHGDRTARCVHPLPASELQGAAT